MGCTHDMQLSSDVSGARTDITVAPGVQSLLMETHIHTHAHTHACARAFSAQMTNKKTVQEDEAGSQRWFLRGKGD